MRLFEKRETCVRNCQVYGIVKEFEEERVVENVS